MSYRGMSTEINFGRSGLNYNPNIAEVPKNAFLWPTRNIDLHRGLAEKRGGTARINAEAVSGSPRIMGMTDYRLSSASSFQVFATADGSVYKNPLSTIKTGMSTSNHFSFETFDVGDVNKLVICDGATVPQIWDGAAASTSSLALLPTDWTGSNFPAQIIRHQQGFATVPVAVGFSTTKNALYIGKDDVLDYTDAEVTQFNCDTGDGYGLVGAAEFGERLFVFGKEKAFFLEDSSIDRADWYLVPAQFNGGAAHFRLIVKTDEDIMCMAQDGTIYSVAAAQEYGDYKLANLARPARIDRWIQDNVNMGRIDDFHAVYDPSKRCVMWFLARSGATQVKCALKYYVDRDPVDAWMVDEQPDYDSGYNASCSARVQTSTGSFRIYTGDYEGTLWKLGESTRSDDGNSYYGGFTIPYNELERPSLTKSMARVWAIVEPAGDYVANYNWWLDGVRKTGGEFSLAGTGAKFGSAQFDSAVFGSTEPIETPSELGDDGRRIKFEVYNNLANQTFAFSSIRYDFKPLGAAVQ
jgi:hypothetical protein